MTRTLTLYVNILLALIILATLVFAFPYAASAFLLYQGAGDLERALLEQGLDPDLLKDADFDDPKLKEASLNPRLLRRSVQRLEQAVRWDSKNRQGAWARACINGTNKPPLLAASFKTGG